MQPYFDPTRKTNSKIKEDDLKKIKKIKKWKTTSKKLEDKLIKNGRRPKKIKYGRRPKKKYKMTISIRINIRIQTFFVVSIRSQQYI